MAIFGIGARYETDVTQDFLSRGVACVGWAEKDAPPAHAILRQLRTGDLIFIKSWTPQTGLTIKAVGVVKEGRPQSVKDLGVGVPVQWVWSGEVRIGKLEDKWPVRTVALYEEQHPLVQARVIALLLDKS
jgi:hypothetical protein